MSEPFDWKWYGDHAWQCVGMARNAFARIVNDPQCDARVEALRTDAELVAEAERVKEYIRTLLKKVKPGTVNRELGMLYRAYQLGYQHDPPLVAGATPGVENLYLQDNETGALQLLTPGIQLLTQQRGR